MAEKEILHAYFAIRRIINVIAVNELKELKMSPKKAAVIRIINEYPNISLACIASMTISDPATITRIIDSLSKDGLVIRKNSKTDRRAFDLSLSEKGKKLAEIITLKHENISNILFDFLSPDEQKTFKGLLESIISKHRANLK